MCVVDAENVLAFRLRVVDFLDHAGQISHVDGGNQVFSAADDWQTSGLLKPRLFEVTVEDGLSLSVKNTSRDNVSFDSFLFEVKHVIFRFLNGRVF